MYKVLSQYTRSPKHARTFLASKRLLSYNDNQMQLQSEESRKQYPNINQTYSPQKLEFPKFIPKNNSSNLSYSEDHNNDRIWDHDSVLNALATS